MAAAIVVSETFAASVELLWQAITDPAKMVQWYFEQISAFEPAVGFKTEFTVAVDGREFVHQWEVSEAIPNKRIAYSWRYSGIAGDGHVTWDIAPSGTGSMLQLTSAGIETFPQDDPLFTREAGEQGWRYFINDRLKHFLDG